jgi:hypothetical protein
MHDKDNTSAATRKDLKPQTIKSIPQQLSNAVIEGFWGGLTAGPAVGEPWQQEPQQTKRPEQQEPEPPKRKHKGHKQPQRSRVQTVLQRAFSKDIPPESELSNKELLRRFHDELKKSKTALHVHDRTVLRAAGRSK